MLAVADMIFIGFIGLFVVVPVVAILSERQKKGPKGSPDADAKTQQKIHDLEATIKQQQAQIQEMKELLTINILKKEDEDAFTQRLNNGN